MAPFVDDLKGKIGGRAAEGLIERVHVVCLFGEAEVSEKSVSVSIEHYVIRFQISIDDIVAMQRFNPQQNLTRIIFDLLLGETSALLEQF